MDARTQVQRRRAAVRAVLAWLVAAFFLVVALAQDARQPGLRLLWAALALVWLVVGVRLLTARPGADPAPSDPAASDPPASDEAVRPEPVAGAPEDPV